MELNPYKKIYIDRVDKSFGSSQTYNLTDENGHFSITIFCDVDTAITAEKIYFENNEGDKKFYGAYQELKVDQKHQSLRLVYR
ncbi:MAG: hypothetical protein P1V97_12655 [Planctomycetota bacterium]|nr:hypothetical protein [Planctomycetota bacterium]